MSSVLGSIFGFGDKLKRRLKDAVSNPSDYAEMTADENRNEWRKNPDERSMGFFNPVPLGTMGNFVLRKGLQDAVEGGTNLSRREFMKKSAGLAGGTAAASIPGAKLLQKFAPEERAVAKQAAVEAAPKYKYNSLKEYLDDVHSESELNMFDKFDPPTAGYHAKEDIPMAVKEWDEVLQTDIRKRLLQDETMYNQAKQNAKQGLEPAPFEVRFDKNGNAVTTEWSDVLSPQAKKEMAGYKKSIDSWNNAGGGVYKDIGKRDWTDPKHLNNFIDELSYYNSSSISHPFMTKDPFNTLK